MSTRNRRDYAATRHIRDRAAWPTLHLQQTQNRRGVNMPNGTMPPCIDVAKLPPLITTETTAAILACSKAQVRRMCAAGQIKASKVGVDWRINTRALLSQFGLEA